MELQLGLGLPSNGVLGLDLNSYVYKPKEVGGGVQVNHHRRSMARSRSTSVDSASSCSSSNCKNMNNKRSFDVAFDDLTRDDMPRTLPLLLWNNHPNDEDDPRKDSKCSSFSSAFNIIEEDSDDGIVGWPPIKYMRRKIRGSEKYRTLDNGCADCYRRPPSNYVKVKMDGVGIARKIDISLYNSFQALKETLLGMFGIYQENSSSYRLTYQDKEGDWLLADDISWRNFIRSAQRLKLMKNNHG